MSENQVLLPLIALLPLLAAGAGLLLRRAPAAVSALLGVLSLIASAGMALAVNAGLEQAGGQSSWMIRWISGYSTNVRSVPPIPLAMQVDYLQLLFILTTCLIGVAVLLYAIRERRDDKRAGQFHALLTFFCGSMLLFLVSDTLILLYIAWELMGLAGYLLIRHRGTPEANRAARQAFWTTRATDFGLLFAIFIFMFGLSRYNVNWVRLSQIDFSGLSLQFRAAMMDAVNQDMITMVDAQARMHNLLHDVSLLLGIAALLALFAVIGKAAQLPLSFWLADAMVAPAPVSALLHSATLVAAGPLLASRILPGCSLLPGSEGFGTANLYTTPLAAAVLLGGLTLLVGAISASCQRQPKKLLAWSTVSQLGLCLLGSGVLAMEAARFQLLGHALFKAALFLGVGIIAARWHESNTEHAAEHEPGFDELRGTGNPPLLFWLGLLPAVLSLAGLVGMAGFFGKDQILSALMSRGSQSVDGVSLATAMPSMPAFWQAGTLLLLASIPFTAAYCARLLHGLWPAAPGNVDADHETDNAAPGWGLPAAITVVLALAGSIGLAAFWPAYRVYFEGRAANLAWAGNLEPLATGLSLLLLAVGAVTGWNIAGGRLSGLATPMLTGVATAFREGLYLKQFLTGLVGGVGEFLAILAGISDIRLLDWLATRSGAAGRGLATAAGWLDLHFLDGIRWWCCEIWWALRRLHGRYWQNGQIQNYMFILLLGAVLICIVVAIPLNETLRLIIDSYLGRYN
ncbi:hypothetical protein KDL44_04870 [bacterium]|nr:hypothetical protein [bacterium]